MSHVTSAHTSFNVPHMATPTSKGQGHAIITCEKYWVDNPNESHKVYFLGHLLFPPTRMSNLSFLYKPQILAISQDSVQMSPSPEAPKSPVCASHHLPKPSSLNFLHQMFSTLTKSISLGQILRIIYLFGQTT